MLRDYFARHGAVCPSNVNPAEFMLEAIGAGVTPRIGNRDWKDVWLDSPEYQRAKQELEAIKVEALKKPPVEKKKLSTCKFGLFTNYAHLFTTDYCNLFRCYAVRVSA